MAMKKRILAVGAAVLLCATLCAAFVPKEGGRDSKSAAVAESKPEPRSGERINQTLTCPGCNQLMTGTFQYHYNATVTVACPHCHKHWLVHYDWVHDPQSAKDGHWQYMLRILSIKKS